MNAALKPIAWVIATGGGSGHFPVAPATFATAVALALLWGLSQFGLQTDAVPFFAIIAVGARVGVEATEAISSADDPDPRRAVWDEFIGGWLTMAFLPLTPEWLIAGFITFRVLDIAKLPPMSTAERLPGGWGIMADDIVAGLIGAVILNAVRLLFF
ncbi:MAG: phosphatidylglycerophosphatase A [Chloroflexota bacterium]